jgi:outer membrane immunogenic protein
MKKLLLSVAAVALSAGSAFAADLPSRKAPPLPPPPPPPPLWTGFHAGLNAGFGFGTNDPVYSQNYGAGTNDHEGARLMPETRSFIGQGQFGPRFDGLLGAQTAALATSGVASMTQNGFVGGGQIGYDYQYHNFVFGVEADIQGSGIRGTSHTIGSASSSASFGYRGFGTESWNAIGGSTVNAGVDWFGTVRGRVGYLWTPTMLVYGTGGLTYGGVYANVNSAAVAGVTQSFGGTSGMQILQPFSPPGANYTFVGGGNKSQTLVGWNAGGGIEWMFMPNWSLKAEALYWNLGSMNVPTASFATAPIGNGSPLATIGFTRVNYQGVIARAGINYHFNWFSSPVVAGY